MSKFFFGTILIFQTFISLSQNLTIYQTEVSVVEAMERLVSVVNEDDRLTLVDTLNHSKRFTKRGKEILLSGSVTFEDPVLTKSLMQCQITSVLDMPLQILVWQEDEEVYMAFVDPIYMVRRFMIKDCNEIIQSLSNLMIKVCAKALRD